MKAFKRNLYVGRLPLGKLDDFTVEISYDGKRLSICGDVGGHSGGQNLQDLLDPDLIPEPGVDCARLHAVWDRWHLNDMRPWDEHMRELGWHELATKMVKAQSLTWGPEYHKLRKLAEAGELTGEQREKYKSQHALVMALAIALDCPKHPDLWGLEGASAIEMGLVKLDKLEHKALGWLRPTEHPEGLLGRPCPVCGKGYGNAWYFEEVPEDVLQWLVDGARK